MLEVQGLRVYGLGRDFSGLRLRVLGSRVEGWVLGWFLGGA